MAPKAPGSWPIILYPFQKGNFATTRISNDRIWTRWLVPHLGDRRAAVAVVGLGGARVETKKPWQRRLLLIYTLILSWTRSRACSSFSCRRELATNTPHCLPTEKHDCAFIKCCRGFSMVPWLSQTIIAMVIPNNLTRAKGRPSDTLSFAGGCACLNMSAA